VSKVAKNLGAFNDELLTDKEVAHILKVSRRTLQDYRNNGILSYIQVGGKILMCNGQ
jgi:predicted site-specific integrase-resolvase